MKSIMKPKSRNPLATALFITIAASAVSFGQSGTWLGNSGDWGVAGTWSSGIATGAGNTANFTGVNITADQTINLDTARTIGSIVFTDLTTASNNLTISGGNTLTLDVASGDAIINVTNQTLTISSKISGIDGLRKNGTGGSLVLSGNNDYTGLTLVSGGILNIQHANALGATGALNNTSVGSAGRLVLQGGTTYAAEALSLTGITSGTNTVTLQSVSGDNEWTGAITPVISTAGHLNRIQSDADTLTLSGELGSAALASRYAFQGAGNITVTGKITGIAGVVVGSVGATPTSIRTLSNNTNDFTGTASVSGGVLAFTSIADEGLASALGAATGANATIGMGSTTNTGILRYTGGGHSSNRVINLAGSTGGGTIESSGSGALVLTSATTSAAGTKTLTLGGINTDNNSIGAIVNGSTGTVSVTKADGGKWIMTGTSGYTGATNVDDGTLLINGNITTSSGTTVASGATLGGTGTVGAVSVLGGGTLAPGTSPGTLTSGTVSLASLSNLNFELNPADLTVGGGINDLVSVTGNLTLDGSLNLTATSGDFLSVVSGTAWRLFNYSGSLTDNTLALGTMPALGSGLSWNINTATANQVNLVVIPEPSAALLGGLGLLALLRRRR